eukprot:symbB.v1.2.001171.t1/scaffold60.1/size581591/11
MCDPSLDQTVAPLDFLLGGELDGEVIALRDNIVMIFESQKFGMAQVEAAICDQCPQELDGCAGPVRETVEEIRHYTKSVMTTLDNAQKLPEPSTERSFSGASLLWYFEQVSPSGPSGCFATCRGLPEDGISQEPEERVGSEAFLEASSTFLAGVREKESLDIQHALLQED